MTPGTETPSQETSPSSRARLPRGPHSLSRAQVGEHQRKRLIAAIGELVGENGYTSTTVADVLARAGVSRKAFYEHFANKQECFFAAYDALAVEGRNAVMRAYASAEDPTAAAKLAITTLFDRVISNPGGVRMMLIEAGVVGEAGIERRERLMSQYETLLRTVLELPPGPGTVPSPVLRGIVGGLNGVLNAHVRDERAAELRALTSDLVRWATSYAPPPQSILRLLAQPATESEPPRALVGGRAPGSLAASAKLNDRRHRGAGRGKRSAVPRSMIVHSQRERILDAVADLVAQDGYGALTVEGIAERATVSLQAFYEHFKSKEEAFLVAYELGHAKGLSIVERAYAAQPDWRLGVRAGISALLDFLASEPAFAHLALVDALTATPRTAECAYDGMADYAAMLVPGVAQATTLVLPPAVTIQAIAGGLFELCLTYVLLGRVERLPELLPRATYFALAPFIGPEPAGEVATAHPGSV